jgi:hypothetical protein
MTVPLRSSAALPLDLPLHHALLKVATPEHVTEDAGEAQYQEHTPDEGHPLHPPTASGRPINQRKAPDYDDVRYYFARGLKAAVNALADAPDLVIVDFVPHVDTSLSEQHDDGRDTIAFIWDRRQVAQLRAALVAPPAGFDPATAGFAVAKDGANSLPSR